MENQVWPRTRKALMLVWEIWTQLVGYDVEVIFGPGNVVIRVELQDRLLFNYPEDELNWEGNHWTNKGKL